MNTAQFRTFVASCIVERFFSNVHEVENVPETLPGSETAFDQFVSWLDLQVGDGNGEMPVYEIETPEDWVGVVPIVWEPYEDYWVENLLEKMDGAFYNIVRNAVDTGIITEAESKEVNFRR